MQVAQGRVGVDAEFVGQGEGLAVVIFGGLDLRGFTPRRNLAEEAQGIRLAPSLLMLKDARQCALSEGMCVLQAAHK